MASIKDKFIENLNCLASPFTISFLNKICGVNLIVPVYHTVSDIVLPHISNIYPVKSTKSFIDDIEYLIKNYEPINEIEQLFDVIKGKKKKLKPYFILTFDDGFSESYNIIFPILKKYKLKAIFFINDNFIDNNELFFRHKASLLINEFINKPELYVKINLDEINVEISASNFKDIISNISHKDSYLLDLIAEKINFSFSNYLQNKKPYLTTEQINKMISEGFYFGSHSVNHLLYNKLPLNEQVDETLNSIRFLKDKFMLNYNLFAFPFTDYGVKNEFFEEINNKEKIDFTFGCAGYKNDSIKNHKQRISFEVNSLSAEKILKSELIYYKISSILGKNTIKR